MLLRRFQGMEAHWATPHRAAALLLLACFNDSRELQVEVIKAAQHLAARLPALLDLLAQVDHKGSSALYHLRSGFAGACPAWRWKRKMRWVCVFRVAKPNAWIF